MFDSFVSQCSSAIGFKEDMFRFMMAFLMEIPITLFLRYLPDNPRLKHMIYGCIGIFISFFIYNGMTFCVFITMLPVYFIMKYMPNKTGAYICFALSLGYLLTLHIKRMLDNYLGYDLDFSSVQMVLTIKFTTFAFSVANANDKDYVCSKYTEQHKIKTYPTLLEFFGYTFFYPAFFSGPALEFTEYIAFVDMSMFDEFGKKVPPISLKAVGN
ncbi:membrane-bound O-acyltransferase mboat family protein, partial [Entamoeba invadens IP1]